MAGNVFRYNNMIPFIDVPGRVGVRTPPRDLVTASSSL